MSAFKRLKKSDVFTIPYQAHKSWSFTYNTEPTSSGDIVFYQGVYPTSSFSLTRDEVTSLGQYESLIYLSINHMFYQSYTGSLNTHSLMLTTTNYESASSQRNTSSYFIYNDSPKFVASFPTGTTDEIQVIAITKDVYGEQIMPGTFLIDTAAGEIIDDGYGNLIRFSEYVGNIFYSHGIAVITNQTYQFWNFPITITFQGQHTIYENYITCTAEEKEFNLTYNPSLLTKSTAPSSSVQDYATGSTFTPYVTSIGLYNDANELLLVAKLAQPIPISSETDMTFLIKYDQ